MHEMFGIFEWSFAQIHHVFGEEYRGSELTTKLSPKKKKRRERWIKGLEIGPKPLILLYSSTVIPARPPERN
jgi:hypothetical protein